MKDIIVVSYATHRAGLLDEYESQLAAAGIDHYLHPITLENGIVSITARWKLNFVSEMCQRFKDYRRIVFTDAWDVLFYGDKWDLMDKLPSDPLISAERNCWPEHGIESPVEQPWSFYNAGMMTGHPKWLHEWAESFASDPDLGLMEQAWMNRRLLGAVHPIDSGTEVFYTVSYDREDGSLCVRNGKPYNVARGSYPQFFHFSGKCSSAPFRKMLRTGEPLCAK